MRVAWRAISSAWSLSSTNRWLILRRYVLYISQLAREQGIKVLLSGAGGDDLFTGYRRHRAVRLERYWSWLPEGVRRGLGYTMARLDQRQAWSRRLTRLFNGAGLDGDARLVNYFRWISESRLQALYTPVFRARLGNAQAIAPMLDFLQPLSAQAEPLERMLALEQRFFLTDHNLIYTDKMSMAAGVEVGCGLWRAAAALDAPRSARTAGRCAVGREPDAPWV